MDLTNLVFPLEQQGVGAPTLVISTLGICAGNTNPLNVWLRKPKRLVTKGLKVLYKPEIHLLKNLRMVSLNQNPAKPNKNKQKIP